MIDPDGSLAKVLSLTLQEGNPLRLCWAGLRQMDSVALPDVSAPGLASAAAVTCHHLRSHRNPSSLSLLSTITLSSITPQRTTDQKWANKTGKSRPWTKLSLPFILVTRWIKKGRFNSKTLCSFFWNIFAVRLGETSKAGGVIEQCAAEGQLISEAQYFACYGRFSHRLWNYRRCEHLPVCFSKLFIFFRLVKYVTSGFIPVHIDIPYSHTMDI